MKFTNTLGMDSLASQPQVSTDFLVVDFGSELFEYRQYVEDSSLASIVFPVWRDMFRVYFEHLQWSEYIDMSINNLLSSIHEEILEILIQNSVPNFIDAFMNSTRFIFYHMYGKLNELGCFQREEFPYTFASISGTCILLKRKEQYAGRTAIGNY